MGLSPEHMYGDGEEDVGVGEDVGEDVEEPQHQLAGGEPEHDRV